MEKRLSLFFVCLLMSIEAAFAQIDVSGTVISQDDNEPIIGASVIISGGQLLRVRSRILTVTLSSMCLAVLNSCLATWA